MTAITGITEDQFTRVFGECCYAVMPVMGGMDVTAYMKNVRTGQTVRTGRDAIKHPPTSWVRKVEQ